MVALRRSVPLQVRIAELHRILRVPATGKLSLGWDNSLSIRKKKEIDVFVKQFQVAERDDCERRRPRPTR